MSSIKDLKQAQKAALEQQQAVQELNALVKSIERCEQTIVDLQAELQAANTNHPSPRTTRGDIAYLTELLRCANKKLAWEKTIASLQKRTPALMDKLTRLLNDPRNPPPAEVRVQILQSLQAVQAALDRLAPHGAANPDRQ